MIKRGREGAVYTAADDNETKVDSDSTFWSVTGAPVDPVTTIRAGCVFSAFLLGAFVKGYDIGEAVRLGNLAAGIACTMDPNSFPDMSAVLRGIRGGGAHPQAHLTPANRKTLSLLYRGVTSDKAIADARGISDTSPQNDIKHLKDELEAISGQKMTRRAQIVPIAEAHGMISLAVRIRCEALNP